MHELVEVEARNLDIGRTGIVAEGVDHLLHGLHLLDDRMRGAIENLGLFLGHRVQIFVAHTLRRKLDWRQRILDFMCQSARHFAPGRVALRLQQRRDVIEDDHVARRMRFVAGQGRAGAGQHATPDFSAQHDLLAPFGLARFEVHTRYIDKLLQQGVFAGDVDQLLATAMFEVHTKDGARGLVRVADRQVAFQRDNTGGETGQDYFEVGALRFDQRLVERSLPPGCSEPLRHVVE